jgi:hypothetical protein
VWVLFFTREYTQNLNLRKNSKPEKKLKNLKPERNPEKLQKIQKTLKETQLQNLTGTRTQSET